MSKNDSDTHTVDWFDVGRWDASQVVGQEELHPHSPLDLACWSLHHNVPVERLVGKLLERAEFDLDQVMIGAGASEEEALRWRDGWLSHAQSILSDMVREELVDAEHLGTAEVIRRVRAMESRGVTLPTADHCEHVRGGSLTCESCGDRVPRRVPTLDDIPVLE